MSSFSFLRLSFIGLLLCCLSGSVFSQLTLQDSLIAYYPFDGNALDMSPNANHGVVNGAIPAVDRHGNANGAYFFDGINDYLSISPSQNFYPELPVTMSAWIRSA